MGKAKNVNRSDKNLKIHRVYSCKIVTMKNLDKFYPNLRSEITLARTN